MLAQVRDQLLATYQGVIDAIISGAPRVILAIVLLIAALVVAKVVERVLRTIMTRLRFDSLKDGRSVQRRLCDDLPAGGHAAGSVSPYTSLGNS